MTTSDDEPGFARQDDALAQTTHADPLYSEGAAEAEYADAVPADAVPADAAPGARWPLAVLAALAVTLLGLVAWAVVLLTFDREYVGIAVLIGLAVGWVVRVVSRRSNIAARVVAVVLTAAACVLGPIVAQSAFAANQSGEAYFTVLGRGLPHAFEVLADQEWSVLLIFGAALVLAWLSAGPQKEKPQKKPRRGATTTTASQGPAEPPADPQLPPE